MDIDTIVTVFRQHGDAQQRKLILRLQRMGVEALTPLNAIYHGNYPTSVKRWAIEALGHFPESATLKTIRSALKSPYMTIRLHAMIGLYHFGNSKNVRYIKPLLSDVSGGIRVNALDIAAHYNPPWLNSALRKLCKDEKSYIRNKAKKLLLQQADL